MFRQLHHAYVDMLCNPFYVPGEAIVSRLLTDAFIALWYNQGYTGRMSVTVNHY